jgi:7-cyano-7-deazaguanine synthase
VIARPIGSSVLLFSGGMDSTALASILRPDYCLFVDYGQRSAKGERRAAVAIAEMLNLKLVELDLDLKSLGYGLLLNEENPIEIDAAPSPEWWPFRNQFLATAGAAVALRVRAGNVLLGSVREDGDRHSDGTADFYARLDVLVAGQEGGVRVIAPAIATYAVELARESRLSAETLQWTMSCHKSELACGNCPGCWKRQRMAIELGFADWV